MWTLRPVPRDVLAALDLERGERVLMSAPETVGERYVVGTDRALHVPVGQAYERIPWEKVEHAEWDREAEQLRVTRTAEYGARMPVDEIHFAPGPRAERLLGLIRERITASVVLDRRVEFEAPRGRSSARGGRVVARRAPAGDSPITWSIVLDPGLEPSDPDVREAADAALDAARIELEP